MPLSFFGCQAIIRRIREESGVNFHAHQLRHTFATSMAGQGVNLYDLKGLMGHTDIQTTQIYLHDNIDRLSEVYRLHSPLSAIPGLGQQIKKARGRPRKWQEWL
jgi:site-specific recombinase XerD